MPSKRQLMVPAPSPPIGAPSGLAAFAGGVHAYFGIEMGEGPLGIEASGGAPPVAPALPAILPPALRPALPPALPARPPAAATLPPALLAVPLAPPPPSVAGDPLFETPQAMPNAVATARASKRAGQLLGDVGRGGRAGRGTEGGMDRIAARECTPCARPSRRIKSP